MSGYHSSRAEFLTDESINDGLKYTRNGGCFVTTKKAIAFVLLALASLTCVIILMYYYGPNTRLEFLRQDGTNDIEKLINETLNKQTSMEDLRLPKHLLPVHYRLWIHPMLNEPNDKNFTFTGRVKILLNCTENTNEIVLNWDELNINKSEVEISTVKQTEFTLAPLLKDTDVTRNLTKRSIEEIVDENDDIDNDTNKEEVIDNDIPVTDEPQSTTELQSDSVNTNEKVLIETETIPIGVSEVHQDAENFKLKIVTKINLERGKTYTIDIKFSGEILNNLVGLYKTSYTDIYGNINWLVTTHFQSIYARRVFPCFDEPFYKAVFELSIARRTNMTTISNMPVREIEPMNATDNWVWDHFYPTPPMSTYLVAFTVSDFESISAKANLGPILKVWAPKDDLSKAAYALEAAQEILPFFEKYFSVKYPLPKLDLVAVPNFGKEAMENWGCIHFRKSMLLFDPESLSIRTKSQIFSKIAHELAHQWFGNLVTMDWWSDLWLNEGFAVFMSEVALNTLKYRWQAYSTLQLRDVYKTLYLDSLKSTHSIQSEISNTAQIEQIFDARMYQKGSSVLKMLNYTLTEPIFKRGVQKFLKKYAYKCTVQDDLWHIFTNSAHNQSLIPENVTIKAFMNTWTKQSGYPVITITRNYSDGTVLINQTKMVDDFSNITYPPMSLWYVPLTYLTKNDTAMKSVWLENVRETGMALNGTNSSQWVLLNIEENGFYRVNYDQYNWQLLQQQLYDNHQKIPVSNRGQLIDDAFQFASTGLINYTVAFDLVKYLSIMETNYIPWYSALRNMEELRVIISNYEYSGLYDNFLLGLVKPMFDILYTKERTYDTQSEKLLKLHIVTSACKLRYGKCIEWARDQFQQWMNQPDPDVNNPIPVDYRFIVQCTAIKSGGTNLWEFLWNRTMSTKISPIDLQTAYLSLGCTYDPWLINRYLEYSLQGNISLENVQYVWKSISHTVGVRTGFQFLRLNWNRIYDTYEDIYLVFSTIFHDFVSQLSTEIDLEDLTTFYKLHQNDLKSVSTILQSTVDQMKVRINWKKKHLNSVVNWLKRNKY